MSCVTLCLIIGANTHRHTYTARSLTLGIDDLGSDGSTCGPEGEIESLDLVNLIDLGREETMSVIVPKGL